MTNRLIGGSVIAALTLLGAVSTQAQDDGNGAPRTTWGAPDLQGVWDFRTITPMQRPEHYGDCLLYTSPSPRD